MNHNTTEQTTELQAAIKERQELLFRWANDVNVELEARSILYEDEPWEPLDSDNVYECLKIIEGHFALSLREKPKPAPLNLIHFMSVRHAEFRRNGYCGRLFFNHIVDGDIWFMRFQTNDMYTDVYFSPSMMADFEYTLDNGETWNKCV